MTLGQTPRRYCMSTAWTSLKTLPNQKFDAVVLTVSHNKFKDIEYKSLKNNNAVVYDVKNFIDDSICGWKAITITRIFY